MIKKVILLYSLFLASCALLTVDEGLGPRLYPLRLKPIIAIQIADSGRVSPALKSSSANECTEFTLSEAEVEQFLKKAHGVFETDYRHMLDWSPCFMKGSVTFKGGESAIWAIHQLKAGSLVLNSGETLYMYCPHCEGKAFVQP